jgi:hypothetical protein
MREFWGELLTGMIALLSGIGGIIGGKKWIDKEQSKAIENNRIKIEAIQIEIEKTNARVNKLDNAVTVLMEKWHANNEADRKDRDEQKEHRTLMYNRMDSMAGKIDNFSDRVDKKFDNFIKMFKV